MTHSPLSSPAVFAAALLMLLLAAAVAPLGAQTTAGPAVAHEVKITLRHTDPSTCGDVVDWREELTGWVGMPGTRIARNAEDSDPSASSAAYSGVVWRTVHASLCRAKCPDGACDGVCNFTIEATGPAELMLTEVEEGARVGIHKPAKYTNLSYGGGTCIDMQADDQQFSLFNAYFVPDLGFIPGDPSVKQLQAGLSLPLQEELGREPVGTFEVLAGCNDKEFNPSPGVGCTTPAKKKAARKP